MLIFFGESAHCICNWFEVLKFLYAYTCPFPTNIKHPKFFYLCSNSKIRKFEDGFSKFWKFEKRSSKFWNIRKIGRGQMNGARKFFTKASSGLRALEVLSSRRMPKVILRGLEWCWPAQKALLGFTTKGREILGETKENTVFLLQGVCGALLFFYFYGPPMFDCLRHETNLVWLR